FRLELEAFRQSLQQKRDSLEMRFDTSTLFAHGPLYSTGSEQDFLFRDFEEVQATQVYIGKGSYGGPMEAENLILDAVLPQGQADSAYIFSIWAYVDEDRLTSNIFHLRELSAEGEVLQELPIHTWMNTATIDPDGWVLVEHRFYLRGSNSRLQVRFGRKNMEGRRTYVDQLLIRPVGRDLFQKTPERLYLNNWFFEP
ncbi:MAG: hypothetical protein KDC44_11310, partial [Phaeodactylibacter sp.]|nr:hypothetical protein [Phaeodactylibacter sp.]